MLNRAQQYLTPTKQLYEIHINKSHFKEQKTEVEGFETCLYDITRDYAMSQISLLSSIN